MATHNKIDIKLDVEPFKKALAQHNELWDEFTFRKDNPESPHREMQDIIFRYNDKKNYKNDRAKFNEEHDAVWYPSAKTIPEVKDLAFSLMCKVRGERLGMVLCTKLEPTKKIAWHTDGGWHAEYYKKYYVAVKNKPGSTFYFIDGDITPDEGDVYEFNNSLPHWVENNSNEDRIALIICIKGDT